MKYSTFFVVQLKDKPGKPWQARLKYKEGDKWRETSKILKDAMLLASKKLGEAFKETDLDT